MGCYAALIGADVSGEPIAPIFQDQAVRQKGEDLIYSAAEA